MVAKLAWRKKANYSARGCNPGQKVKTPLGDVEALLCRGSPKRSDNDLASSDEESKEDVPDDMDDVFTMERMEDTMLPKTYSSRQQWRWYRTTVSVAEKLREDVLMPIDVNGQLYSGIDTGMCCSGGTALLQDVLLTSIRWDVVL